MQNGGGQTAATNALASAAYRDGGKDSKLDAILGANSENHPATVKPPKLSLFEPSLGEAFCRAVEARTLGAGRKPLIQSFGADPQTVVEHCLAASRIRKERDRRLRLIMLVCGVLFLPGLLLWLGLFQIRKSLASKESKHSWLGTVLLVGVGLVVAVLMFRLPLTGFLGLYTRGMIIAPALGWLLARRTCESTARDLRERWDGLLSGGGVAAKIPEAVPGNPDEKAREDLRHQLAKLTAEDRSNQVFYAGPKGILGMGTRWGNWQMAEELAPKDEAKEIHPFRAWDVIRAIDAQLRKLERGPLHTGGFPPAAIQHWIVTPVGEGAAEVARPTGENVDAFLVKPHEVTRICNEQQFNSGNRHYLGIQYPLWDGQLIINMLVTVTVLYKTLRVDVTAHALGPVHGLFTTKSKAPVVEVPKSIRFWETVEKPLPLVDTQEVVRLAVRAPLTWYPPVLDFFGGKLVLPEPFGLRHVWASSMWRHRFMADDALRTVAPVLRSIHTATFKVLEENGVDTERFTNRSSIMSGLIQEPSPRKADVYDA
ncbi:membrane protein [Streptomyces sp. XY593]|nr:membrane protein [Streptomyces sp. XY533]KOU92714.1 membrane protein [Streptomyces sp. XY593]KOV52486.1 membrane protein [Streptomyces sp. H036]